MHLVDTTLFFAPRSGGVRRYLLTKQRYLAAQGVRHTLVVPGPWRSASQAGLKEIASPLLPFGKGYRIPARIGPWRDALCELEPDLIEAGDPYHVAWAALSAAHRLGIPAIAFAHSDLSCLAGQHLGRAAEAAVEAYLRRLYRRFDLVLAPSHSMAARLHAIGVEQVVVQPLGVDTHVFNPVRRDPALRAELGLPTQTRLLVYAGRLAADKKVGLLRSAVERLGAPYHLLIVGGSVTRRLCAHATMLPYEQDPIRLARLLASCDALIHAGEHETFGLVFIEAMACGRPVIGVRSGAVPELVDETVGRIAAPRDVASLEAAILSLYEDNLDALGRAARARAEHLYARDRTLNQQLTRYARLVPTSATARPAASVAGSGR